MREHHAKAIANATKRLREENPHLVAIILGGSIAKGTEREDSDVDLIVVVPDDAYEARRTENRVAFLWKDVCDYQNGYVEGRFVSVSYILQAADRGSEPTRHSFTGASAVYCTDPSIEAAIKNIPVYPAQRRQDNIASFKAQMNLNRWFFWGEGKRRSDRYLQTRAATEIVLFGCRLILAHNGQLFACQKRLTEQTLAAPECPAGLQEKIDRLFAEMSDEAKEDFCKAIMEFADWGKSGDLSRFLQDVEMSWFNRVHAVSEW